MKEQKQLDPAIHAALPDDWPLSRIDTLLRALLRCGVYEIMNRKDFRNQGNKKNTVSAQELKKKEKECRKLQQELSMVSV